MPPRSVAATIPARGARLDHLAIGILAVGHLAKPHGAHVFLVLAHQQVLDLRAAADRDEQQTGGQGIERPAVTDLLRAERATRNRHDVMRGHAGALSTSSTPSISVTDLMTDSL